MSASPARQRVASLGTTLRDARAAWVVALAVFVYDLVTLARDLTAYDSPELALAAAQLGLSHPIGQPLHTLLGALFARLPFVTPLVGLAILSAVMHALTVLPAASLAEQLTPAAPLDEARRARLAPALRAVVVGAVLLTAPIWECATRVEVYTLSTFGVAWAFAHAASMAWERELSANRALVLGLALGLTASANAYHAVLAALALAPLAVRVIARRLDQPAEPTMRALGRGVLGGVLGALLYLYVPLVGGRTDVVVWGAPTDAESLSAYFGGADYGHNRGTTLAEMLDHLAQWIAWSAQTPVLVVLVVGAIAHTLWGRERGVGREASVVLSVGSIALLCSHRVFHVDITDYQNYLAPALVVAAAGLAAGCEPVVLARPALGAPALATLVLVCAAAPPALWSRTRGSDHAIGLAARGALAEAPERALIVVASDHWAAPMLYLQEVEHLRPDVVVVVEGLSSSSWYWAHVRRRHPDLPDFELSGPGGREGRLRRLVEAASDSRRARRRPVVGRRGRPANLRCRLPRARARMRSASPRRRRGDDGAEPGDVAHRPRLALERRGPRRDRAHARRRALAPRPRRRRHQSLSRGRPSLRSRSTPVRRGPRRPRGPASADAQLRLARGRRDRRRAPPSLPRGPRPPRGGSTDRRRARERGPSPRSHRAVTGPETQPPRRERLTCPRPTRSSSPRRRPTAPGGGRGRG